MLYDCLEDYLDDINVKSKEVYNNLNDLKNVLVRDMQYKLRMKLLQCTF